MFFALLVSALFSTTPYLPYIGGWCRLEVLVGREEFKWHQPVHHQLWSHQGPHFSQCTTSYGATKDLILVHRVQLKPMIKAHSSGRMVSSGIRDVVITSVHSEKTRPKKLIMMLIMIITEKPFTSK